MNIKSALRTHPSGKQILSFSEFYLPNASIFDFETAIKNEASAIQDSFEMIGVYLNVSQVFEKEMFEKLGYTIDGYTFSTSISEFLKKRVSQKLSQHLTVDFMNFETDIEAVSKLEIASHGNDKTSRVTFDSQLAIKGMRNYYQRACNSKSVFLLRDQNEIIAVIGFIPHHKNSDEIHISSVSIHPLRQNEGLFFPFLSYCIQHEKFSNFTKMSGVTTTQKLLAAAEKYDIKLEGWSLSKARD